LTTPSISRVTVEDDGIDRVVTLVIGQGRKGNGYTAEASSVPPEVRAYLLDWLGAESSTAGGGPGSNEPADDAPGVGFRAPPDVSA